MNGNLKLYTGVVENRMDPLKLGRCQVRVVGLHTDNKTALPTEDLPWAYPIQPITSAGVSGIGSTPLGPVEGSWLLIAFMDPDCQQPIMLGSLGGAFQTPDALQAENLVINNIEPSGTVAQAVPVDVTDPSTVPLPQDGKVYDSKESIIGPLAKLIATAESGAAGYNAFNRGTSGGKIVGGGSMDLTTMKISDIMAKQALPPGSPDRLFAVGKYQTIPSTLREACTCLNVDVNTTFNETIQDVICQEYLVGRKRPPLMAYYRNPDKNNESLLKAAGRSLAAEFASIEDPEFPGYPYGGPNGRYFKSGNKAKTTYAQIKSTLIAEWDFRNNGVASTTTTALGGGDKVDKGTDYYGVAKLTPKDDSVKSTPRESSSPVPSVGGVDVGSLASNIPSLGSIGGLSGLQQLGLDGLLGVIPTDLIESITSQIASVTQFVNSIDISGPIEQLTGGASSILSDFGNSISEIASNLGIENITGSIGELASNLGLATPSAQGIVTELEKIANSSQGQALALLKKIEAEGESTVSSALPSGTVSSDGSISTGNPVDPTVGFQDPSGKYPKYKNEPDTNRLASNNNLGRTYVVRKEAAVKKGVKIANGGTWDQSPVPYNAVYPYNHVTQYESGHIMEFDDTPGSERVHIYHKSGAFIEWDANGTQVNRIVGDGYEIYERNGYVYVKGALNVSVDGALNLRTDNILNLEVSGAAKINIYNDANINVSGNANLAVGAELNAKANKINLESVGQFNIKAGTGLNIQSESDMNIRSEASVNMQAGADINQKSAGSVFIDSAINANVKAAENVNLQGDGDININAAGTALLTGQSEISVYSSGMLAMDASMIDMQNDSSSPAGDASEAIEATEAGQADLELPIETRGTSGVSSLPQLSVPNRSIEQGFETPQDIAAAPGAYAAYQSAQIANNNASQTEIKSDKFVAEAAKPEGSSGTGKSVDTSTILNMDPSQFTAGMKLSQNFTLGELTKGGTRIPRQNYVVDGKTYTPQQIVANLKNLCENSLEPIVAKYGKTFTITSGFRRPAVGNQPGDLGTSGGKIIQEGGDHPIGCAVDIVFQGSKVDNFERCKELPKMLSAWNQIIMEYNNGTQHWIHISYRPPEIGRNQGHCFTMNNHKRIVASVNAGFVLV